MRIRYGRLAVLATSTALVIGVSSATAARADVSPIFPANRPTPLIGAVNGMVPMSRLIHVAPNCIAAREAGPSLARIFALARASKVPLAADQCYRPLIQEVQFANQANQPGNNPACVATVGTSSSGAPVGHSYHGWGKAVDLTDGRDSLTFASPGYAFMKRVAGSLGWNHPAFAEPGGSTCPEPWHWEWVGDGGNLGASPRPGGAVAMIPSADDRGYAVVDGLGRLSRHGDFVNRGGAGAIQLQWVMVNAVATRDRGGYWMVGADGGVFTFGDAHFYGSTGNMHLNSPVIGMAPAASGRGYWMVAADGGIFTFGDATFHNSLAPFHVPSPTVGMVPTRTGGGYWILTADGAVYGFGDAKV